MSQVLLIIANASLSIFFNLFSEKIRRMPGLWGFIINFIFYIPCIIGDFFVFVKEQLRLTPSVTYLLLYVETIVLAAYFILPFLYANVIAKPQQVVMNKPRFLDRRETVIIGKD